MFAIFLQHFLLFEGFWGGGGAIIKILKNNIISVEVAKVVGYFFF
jgi:hypothetical protein